MRLRGLVALAAAAAFVLAPAGARSAPANPQLMATVGPGFFIRLAHPDGSIVTKVDPGIYDIVVRDLGVEHNFHLSGPGVDRFTQVEEHRERHLDRDVRRRSLRVRVRPALDDDARLVRRRQPAATAASAAPATAGSGGEEAAADGRADGDDHAPQRGGQGAPRAQGRHLHGRRPRPLEAAQRPPGRQGRQPQVRPRGHRHAHVEGEALRRARSASSPIAAPQTVKGSIRVS